MGAVDRLAVNEAGQKGMAVHDLAFAASRCELIHTRHPERAGLEKFIADVFRDRYGAKIAYFHRTLMGCRDASGQWIAAVGFSPMHGRQAFLDVYLDAPAESLIASKLLQRGDVRNISRRGLVEVGNLAATRPGGARALILEMTRYLHLSGFEWVVITATSELTNSLKRLGYEPHALCQADPDRLADRGASWGTYYGCAPQVTGVDIAASYAVMQRAV